MKKTNIRYYPEHIEKAIFSVLRNYSDEDLQMVMKLMDDVEKVWQELPW